MPKSVSFRKGLSSLLFWSVISAAFIGPGTVTTAAKAGAGFGLALLWALFFSTLATILLQEAAARITIASGQSLGQVLNQKFQGPGGQFLRNSLFFAVAFGCAAYQTGNILGALSGIELIAKFPSWIPLLLIGGIATALLLLGNIVWIARCLGLLVAIMGALFIYLATQLDLHALDILSSAFKPTFPEGATLLITALIGTTIVPYNLFLASGISRSQNLREMRIGLILAIAIGGIISMAILLVGTSVEGAFSFEALAATLYQQLGPWAARLLALGLFAAGLSSAITAPLAAAVTGSSLLNWKPQGTKYKATWMSILAIGLLFSLLQVKPIPAIILAQAINGVLLPFVAIFLFLAVNDRHILGDRFVNHPAINVLFLLITGLAVWLGLHNIIRLFDPESTEYWTLFLKGGGVLFTWVFLILRISNSSKQ
ncbi:MAG: divalent metal cation transporter [Saprospiraceae bacterium]|nr:divalent metal cation transporter [Saprospiraceae bacterium]